MTTVASTIGGFIADLSPLPELIVLLVSLVVIERVISYVINRDKWTKQYRWPLVIVVGAIASLHALVVMPVVGLNPSELVALSLLAVTGLVITHYGVGPTDHWNHLFYRPLVLTYELYAVLVGVVDILQSDVLLKGLPAMLSATIMAIPAPYSVTLGVVGLFGGTVVSVNVAYRRIHRQIDHMEPPSKHGDFVCAGRVAADDSTMTPNRSLKSPTATPHSSYNVICHPSDSPEPNETLHLSPADFNHATAINNSDTGKARVKQRPQTLDGTIHETPQVVAALTFEYEDSDQQVIRFPYISVRKDRLGEEFGQELVDYAVWELDADRYITAVDNPYDYQALYEIGFEYTGQTTPTGVELERPRPTYTNDAPSDRTAETYRDGLRSFLEESDLDESLSKDACTFIDEHVELEPPSYQSYWLSYYQRQSDKVEADESVGPAVEPKTEQREKRPSSTTTTSMSPETGMTTDQPDREQPTMKRYTHEELAGAEYGWHYSDKRFDDIGGYYDVKQALVDDIIEPLRAAARGDDRFERFGIEPERGILFFGPPGTGKTLFARALAGELGVPFVELSPADVTSKWINEGPERVRLLFEEANQLGPCVIFLDEAEHLFGGRDTGDRSSHAEDRKITSEFLVHLTNKNREALVVAATNRPVDIDPAILRPGRLTAHYEIGLPDAKARHAILQSKLEGVPAALSGDQLADLADHTRGFTGADLENLVDEAKRTAAKRDADAVTIDDFPSFEELDAMVADIERAFDGSTLPDPDDPSEMTPPTDDTDEDDDSAVGYQ